MRTFFRVMWTYNAICICILLVLLAIRPSHRAVGEDAGARPEVAENLAAYCPLAYFGQIEGAHYYWCMPRNMCMGPAGYVTDDRMHTLSECSVCSDPIYAVKGYRKPEFVNLQSR